MPANAIGVWCNKGLKQIEEDLTNKDISFRLGYYVMIWQGKDDVCYTYGLKFFKRAILEKFNGVLPVFKISNKDFLFYAREGDFYIKTDVSGGGTNYRGVIAGSILLGLAGAIVASRKKTHTTTTEVDKRTTILYYKHNNELVDAHFDKDAYNSFKSLFPAKDTKVLDRLSKLTSEKDDNMVSASVANAGDDVYVKIEKLGDLRDKGYITEEEFNLSRWRARACSTRLRMVTDLSPGRSCCSCS